MTQTSAPPPAPDLETAEPDVDQTPDVAVRQTKPTGGLFRAFWRWHFYASILVVPIMFMLAVTGLTILYKWQIDPALHRGVLTVDVPARGAATPLSAQESAVKAAYPGGTVTAVQQGFENRASYFTVSQGEETLNVYVNPYTAAVTGAIDPGDLLSNIATEIHGKIIFGSVSEVVVGKDPALATGLTGDPADGADLTSGAVGDRIIELAVCWAIVMTITGYYLYLRGRGARLKRLSAKAKAAGLRNNHARYGAILGVGFLLLVLSGLPWTGFWGSGVQKLATGQGSSLWGDDPGATSTLGEQLEKVGSNSNPAPWAEGAATLPDSTVPAAGDGHAGHTMSTGSAGAGSVNIDAVMTAARADGLPEPYHIVYPDGEEGVFSVLADQWNDKANPAATDVSKERVAHVDQYSGQVIGRYGYSEYSVAAKVVTQGIALHEGRRLGSFNLVASTAFCLGVIFLCVSGPLMWWKRRPKDGGLAAPRGRMPLRATPALAVVVVLLGIFLPLFGASLLVVLLLDRFVIRRVPALTKRFSTV